MKTNIEKLDNFGNGITYVNNKITFVPKTLPGDECEISLIKEKRKTNYAKLDKIIKPSVDRINAPCPYFNICGGCALQNMRYENSIKFKENKIKDILKRSNINCHNYEFIKNEHDYNYRNKISLKIMDKKIGYYEASTHTLVEISSCLIAKNSINKIIQMLPLLNIKNGSVTIRSNYNDEILIIINTENEIKEIPRELATNNKLVGIILNDKTIYGDNHFMEIINNIIYEVSYNSFFQVNNYISSLMAKIVSENVIGKTLDLYCGVGFLSLKMAKSTESVIGIEIIENAIINALKSKKMNKIENAEFVLGDLANGFNIDAYFDTIVVDPPRNGINTRTMKYIIDKNPQKIIYVSCDPNTLARDLIILQKDYEINKIYMFDMFSYTYHVECACVLNRR